MIDPAKVARELAVIFPDMKEEDLLRRFTDGRSFLWLRRKLSPEQVQAVHDIGDPGLLFGPREMRLYPNGRLAAHVLGGYAFGAEGVDAAEVIGTAGIEKAMDVRFARPRAGLAAAGTVAGPDGAGGDRGNPSGGHDDHERGGRGGDPDGCEDGRDHLAGQPARLRPERPPATGGRGRPGRQSVVQPHDPGRVRTGVHLQDLRGGAGDGTGAGERRHDDRRECPMRWGKHKNSEFKDHNYGTLSVNDIIVKSSNVGSAKLGPVIGAERQQAFLKSLGFFDPTPLELVEAPGAKPLIPTRWPEIVTITTSYGHGMSASPMHLATAYAAIANGGSR